MGTQLYQDSETTFNYEPIQYSFFKKYIILRFHPCKMILDILGVIWASYFLWRNQAGTALISILLFSGLGFFLVRHIDPNRMARTVLGRFGLLCFHPLNLSLQLLGIFPLVYGLWVHSLGFILIGLSLWMLGHSFGWSRVNENLEPP